MKHELIPVSEFEYSLKNPDIELRFCCMIQESEMVDVVREFLGDNNITAVLYHQNENGEFDHLLVRYGYPTFRADDAWFQSTKGTR